MDEKRSTPTALWTEVQNEAKRIKLAGYGTEVLGSFSCGQTTARRLDRHLPSPRALLNHHALRSDSTYYLM